MDLGTKIEFALKQKITPSEKVALIALMFSEKDLTTHELNSYTNSLKTFENYKDLFEEAIAMGIVTICPIKNSSGYIRQHFCINEDVLEKLIEKDN